MRKNPSMDETHPLLGDTGQRAYKSLQYAIVEE